MLASDRGVVAEAIWAAPPSDGKRLQEAATIAWALQQATAGSDGWFSSGRRESAAPRGPQGRDLMAAVGRGQWCTALQTHFLFPIYFILS